MDTLSAEKLFPMLFPDEEPPPSLICAIGNETIPLVKDFSQWVPGLKVQLALRPGIHEDGTPGWSMDWLNDFCRQVPELEVRVAKRPDMAEDVAQDWSIEWAAAAYPMETLGRAQTADCLVVCGTSNLYKAGRSLVYTNAAKSGCRLLVGFLPPESVDLSNSVRMTFLLEISEEFSRQSYEVEFVTAAGAAWTLKSLIRRMKKQTDIFDQEEFVAVIGRLTGPSKFSLSLPELKGAFLDELRRQGVSSATIRRRIAAGVQTDRFVIQPFLPWVEPGYCSPPDGNKPGSAPLRLPPDHTLATLLITSGDEEKNISFPTVERLKLEDGVAYLSGEVSFWVWDTHVFHMATLAARDVVKKLLRDVSGPWSLVLAGAFVKEQRSIRFLPLRIACFEIRPTFLARAFAGLPAAVRNGLGLGAGQRQVERFISRQTRKSPYGLFFSGDCASPTDALKPMFQNYQNPSEGIEVRLTNFLPQAEEGSGMVAGTAARLALERIMLVSALAGDRSELLAANAYMCGEAQEKEEQYG